MSQLLDDFKDESPEKDNKPNKAMALIAWGIFLFLGSMQLNYYGTSESKLVFGSYFWMPFLVIGVLGLAIAPKKAILAGFLTVPVTFVFYEILWPML